MGEPGTRYPPDCGIWCLTQPSVIRALLVDPLGPPRDRQRRPLRVVSASALRTVAGSRAARRAAVPQAPLR
jgi:hypothetical protein